MKDAFYFAIVSSDCLVGFDQVLKCCVPFDHHSVPQSVSEEEIIILIIWGRKQWQLADHIKAWSWR